MIATSGSYAERQTLSDIVLFDLEVQEDGPLRDPSLPPRPSIAIGPWQSVSKRPLPTGHLDSVRLASRRRRAAEAGPAAEARRRAQGLSVSILTCANGDAYELRRKLENTLALCRDSVHRTEILVGCAVGHTAALDVALAYAVCGVRVLTWTAELPPLSAWARLAHAAQNDVVVFSDITARMAPETLDDWVAPLGDGRVGMAVPRYVACVDDGQGPRPCLDPGPLGINGACYAGLALRRRLLRRAAHDTVEPGLAAALQVLGRGHEVVVVPQVRVFYRESSSARARFTSIAQRTHGQLQAAARLGSSLPPERNAVARAIVRDGTRYVPVVVSWLSSMLVLAACGFSPVALLMLVLGALAMARAHDRRLGTLRFSRVDRLGEGLTVGAAQVYGILRALTQQRRAASCA